LRQLCKNTHHNAYLQNSWNIHGKDNFEFVIVQECNIDDLHKIEQEYLDANDGVKYNILKTSTGGDTMSKHPNKKEISARIHAKLKKNNNYGMTNKKHTQETKNKISESKKGKQNNGGGGNKLPTIHVMIDNIKYNSIKEASVVLNIKPWVINKKCRSNDPKFNNYIIISEHKVNKKPYKPRKKSNNTGSDSKKKPIIVKGVKYTSYTEASKELGISRFTIRSRCKSSEFTDYILLNYNPDAPIKADMAI